MTDEKGLTPPEPIDLPIGAETTSIEADNAESVVQSIISATNDSRKVRYLGFRASGFTVLESLALIGVTKYPYKTLNRWRNSDPIFVAHEANLSELRKTLGVEFAHIEFMRNLRLVMQKDFEVITKSLSTQRDDMSPFENQYLLKTRGFYTPQSLQIMQQMVGASKEEDGPFNFEEFVMTMSRKRETHTDTVTIEGRR
jgi:hypothetical protein